MSRYVALNNISIDYSEDFIRDYFEMNQIATIASLWVQVNPELYYDAIISQAFKTQDIIIEIDEWFDTEIAYNTIYNIKYCGGCVLQTSPYGNYIYATHYEIDADNYNTDDENQSIIEEELDDDNLSEVTVSDSGYLTDECDDDYGDNNIYFEDLTPFQQTLLTDLLTENEDDEKTKEEFIPYITFEELTPMQQTLFEQLFDDDNYSKKPFIFGRYSTITSV